MGCNHDLPADEGGCGFEVQLTTENLTVIVKKLAWFKSQELRKIMSPGKGHTD